MRSLVTLPLLLLLCACAAATTAPPAAPPTIQNPPRWGWGSLGDMAFLHAGDPAPYTAPDLALLAKFPMVQFDKKQGLGWPQFMGKNASTEERIVAAARAVKKASPTATTLLYVLVLEALLLVLVLILLVRVFRYINGLIDFPASRLRAATRADTSLLLRNTAGVECRIAGNGVYDVRNPKMRAVFVADAMYGMESGAIDGVFIDRANWCEECSAGRAGWDKQTCDSMVPAQRLLLSELTAALGEGNITLAKEHGKGHMIDWQASVETVCARCWFTVAFCDDRSMSETGGERRHDLGRLLLRLLPRLQLQRHAHDERLERRAGPRLRGQHRHHREYVSAWPAHTVTRDGTF